MASFVVPQHHGLMADPFETLAAPPPPGPTSAHTNRVKKDKKGELTLMNTTSEKLVTADAFPEVFKFTEPGNCYAKETEAITKHYDGRDAPSKKHLKPTDSCRPLNAKAPCSLLFGMLMYDATSKSWYTKWINVGSPSSTESGFYMSWHMASQRPGLKIHIKRPDSSEIVAHVFMNAIVRARSENGIDHSLQLHWGSSETTKRSMPVVTDESLRDLEAQGDIFVADFQTWAAPDRNVDGTRPKEELDGSHGQQQQHPGNGPKKSPPLWTGITASEIRAIHKQWAKGEALLPWQLVVHGLAGGSHRFQAFRHWTSNANPVQTKIFSDWMRASLDMTATYGNHWIYSLQPYFESREGCIFDSLAPVEKAEMPRHMVTEWRGNFNADGSIRDAIPFKCNSFDGKQLVYPDDDTMAFELKIAIGREHDYQAFVLKNAFNQPPWTIVGTFVGDPRHPSIFRVDLRGTQGSLLSDDRNLRPKVGSRIEIDVKAESWETTGIVLTLRGKIVDDLWRTNAEISAYVHGPELSKLFKDHTWSSPHGVDIQCIARLLDDPTPSDRHRAAVETLQDGVSSHPDYGRDRGADFRHIILRSPPAIDDTRTGMLGEELLSSEAGYDAFSRVIARRDLNNVQREAALKSATSRSGLTVTQGPPGTGKTYAQAAVAEAHVRTGYALGKRRPVLCTAGSNVAVDAFMVHFIKGLHPGDPPLVIVRYKGVLLGAQKRSSTKTADILESENPAGTAPPLSSEEARSLDEALWELTAEFSGDRRHEMHEEYGFWTQREKWMTEVCIPTKGTDREHEMATTCFNFLAARRRLQQEPGMGKATRKELKEASESLEQDINRYFLRNVVDAVFVTNSSSAHEGLHGVFEPKVHFGDEAAVTSIADTITPIASFINTLELSNLSGDHMQQRPIVQSKGANEFAQLLEISLFEYLFENDIFDKDDYKTTLTEQRRMHPLISNLISAVMYPKVEGGLIDHPDTLKLNAKAMTLQAFIHTRLGAAYNGKSRRLLIDVSGLDVNNRPIASCQGSRSTSWTNETEALAMTKFVEEACKFPPPLGGEKIEPSDFLVMSPYGDQCTLSKYQLSTRGVGGKDHRARVISTRIVQGEESLFCLFSMARTDPENPYRLGMAGDRYVLNVSLSRPKQFIFCFGNWVAQLNEMFKNAPVFSRESHTARFHIMAKIMDFCWEQDEVIAWEDFSALLDSSLPIPTKPAILDQVMAKSGGTKGKGRRLDQDEVEDSGASKRLAPSPSVDAAQKSAGEQKSAGAGKKRTRRGKGKGKGKSGS